jgi:hypothetical protein
MFGSYDMVSDEDENFVERKWWLTKISGGEWISHMLWNCSESLLVGFREAATFVGQRINPYPANVENVVSSY